MCINMDLVKELLQKLNSFPPEEGWNKIQTILREIIDEINKAQFKNENLQNDMTYSNCISLLMEIKEEYPQTISDKRRATLKTNSAKIRTNEFYNYYFNTIRNIQSAINDLLLFLE